MFKPDQHQTTGAHSNDKMLRLRFKQQLNNPSGSFAEFLRRIYAAAMTTVKN